MMLRRGSLTKLQLGPPLRVNSEEEHDGVPEQQLAIPSKPQLTHDGCSTDNKENVISTADSNTLERRLPHSKKGTPSSTYPSYLNPDSAQRTGEKKPNRNQDTPSSTFPESHPPLQPPSHCSRPATSTASRASRGHDMNGTAEENHAFPIQDGSISKRIGSVSKQFDSVQKTTTPRPPTATARQGPRCTNPEKRLTFSPPEHEPSVVVMRAPDGERRFKKLVLLGCGGSSKVYKVISEEYQIYALKEIYMKHVDPAIKRAYVNEIKLLMKLRDEPEIITLHDYTWDKKEGVLYLLLEYAEMDLNAVIKNSRGSHSLVTAAYLWNEMLQVVKVIHEADVIHNDLKPDNFVCIGLRLKLIDFGIANRIEEEKTSIERDIRCGTINYMAPETIETYEDKDFFKVGRPSDVWSLGCILYLMIYGRTPFEHIRNKLAKWHAITDPAIPIPYPDCGNKAAIDVMQKCLRRNPKERPTVSDLLLHPFSSFQCPHGLC